MISERQVDILIESLIKRSQEANVYFLKRIGEIIKKIGTLKPNEAQRLIQILKYNGNIEQIMQEISRYSNLNIKDLDNIFSSYAKKDQQFYKKFYKYRNIPFVEYAKNEALKMQTEAIKNMIRQNMYDFTRNNILGYTIKDSENNTLFLGLKETYNKVLDEAYINILQGKETFNNAMSRILTDIGESGLKIVNYESGRNVRLDSVIRMQLQDGLSLLHNENQKIIGEEFGYNGIEVTHHPNAAPDHIDTIDGKQFALIDKIEEQIANGMEKEIKLEDISGDYVTVKGKRYQDFNAMNESLDRKVSTLNCRHTTFSIIVGVSKPNYTQEQLDEDREKNLRGFELDGKHYSLYDGEQLQRQLERKVREQKDIQILAKASGNNELIQKSQEKITQYTNKYKELSQVSGLPTRMERMKVSGYKRTKVKKNNITGNLYNSTNEWLEKATPNSHEIKIDKTYISNDNVKHPIKGKETVHLTSKDSVEYKRSQWIETTFGGEISNVPRITDISNSKLSVHTPDFIWKKEKWDLKTPEPLNKKSNVIEAFAKKKKAKLQANNFIVDIKNTELNNKEIYDYTIDTMTKRKWLNKIMIVKGNKLLFIIEKK